MSHWMANQDTIIAWYRSLQKTPDKRIAPILSKGMGQATEICIDSLPLKHPCQGDLLGNGLS